MRIAEVRAHVLVVFRLAAGGGNIAIAVGARLRDVAGSVGIGLAAALILVVAGLVVGSGIFCVGGLDLRFGFGEFAVEFEVRLVALVLIVLVVFCRFFSAFVL